ncbi:MAG: hypothetical protein AAF747_03675 [Planctomycetota bacterium]
MAKGNGLSTVRSRLEQQRQQFAAIAADLGIDEPTRFFTNRVLDAFERLDLDLRSLDYAHRHADDAL